MKVLVAGSGEGYQNYLSACELMGIDADLLLSDVDPKDYDGLIMPGGVDINPSMYNMENAGSVDLGGRRNIKKYKILDDFYKAGKPIFGTCRGCQLMNVYFGGTLLQDIQGHRIENDGLHGVSISKDSFLYDLYGEKCMVNSTHHQCVGRLGDGLVLCAVSDDDIPEAFYCDGKPVFAVQWHPERIMETGGREIYQYFIDLMNKKE